MTTPVPGEQPAVEELVLGPSSRGPVPRWLLMVASILAVVLVCGLAVWRFWPQPATPLSLAQLQDAYAGMVRGDGVNDASVLTRRGGNDADVTVSPTDCTSLVETIMINRMPATALDGVGTYWLEGTWSIALFTLRFDDSPAAQAELTRAATALDDCAGQRVSVAAHPTSGGENGSATLWRAVVGRTSEPTDGTRLSYTLATPDGFTIAQLMTYRNTVSWQFRYAAGVTRYADDPADQLIQSLQNQLDAVAAAASG
ncbi:MAG: hypothetical protein QM650_07700 [Microlunatus sp.]